MRDRYLGAWLALAAVGSLAFYVVGLNPVLVPVVCALAALAQYAAIRAREDREAALAAELEARRRREAFQASPLGQFAASMDRWRGALTGQDPRGQTERRTR